MLALKDCLWAHVEASPDFVAFYDARNRHLRHLNPSGRAMAGLGEAGDLSGLAMADLHPRWVVETVFERILPSLAATGSRSWRGEAALLNREGHEIPASMILAIHPSEAGGIGMFSLALRDPGVPALDHQLLFENSHDALMLLAPPTWRFTNANAATVKLFGAGGVAEFTALGPWEVSPPYQPDGRPSSEKAQEMIARAMRYGSHFFEWEHRRLNGDAFAADVLLNRIEIGRNCFLQATVRDISRRKHAEETVLVMNQTLEKTVMERTAELRCMMDNLPYMTWLKDVDGHFMAVNKALADYVGVADVGAMIGKTDRDFSPPELADKYAADDREVMRSRRQMHFEEKMDVGGRSRWMEIFKTPVIDEQGKLLGIVGFARDITERRKTEDELRISAAAFETRDGMIITDASGVILRVNQAFLDCSGYRAEEVVGLTPRIFKSGRHEPAFYAEMWENLLRTGNWQGEIWDRRKNGEVYPKWLNISAVKGPDGEITHFVSSHTDITERRAAEEKIRELAYFDTLTKLPNRSLLLDRLQRALVLCARTRSKGALFFVDLDDFKTLNDTLGHDKGDLLLQEVARRIQSCVRAIDTAARFGGDEFVVLLEGLGGQEGQAAQHAKLVGEKIIETMSRPFDLAGEAFHSSLSIGITLFDEESRNTEELLKQADIAMYQAKSAGRNTLRFFNPELQLSLKARAMLEDQLRQAIRERQFVLYCQPQTAQGRLIGAEALVRWCHPSRGLVAPAEFIPLAEETGMIMQLGLWVLESACARLAAWEEYLEGSAFCLSVNVSARQIHHSDFVAEIFSVLDRTGADPRRLKLEMTETMLLHDVEDVIAKMNLLKERGVTFSLDDFGTGYSSLNYLKRLPLSQLKIDRSFVQEVLTDPNDAAIVRTVVALGKSLGLDVIAEGVETEEQRDFLAANGCTAFQGYLIGRPVPGAELEAMLRALTAGS